MAAEAAQAGKANKVRRTQHAMDEGGAHRPDPRCVRRVRHARLAQSAALITHGAPLRAARAHPLRARGADHLARGRREMRMLSTSDSEHMRPMRIDAPAPIQQTRDAHVPTREDVQFKHDRARGGIDVMLQSAVRNNATWRWWRGVPRGGPVLPKRTNSDVRTTSLRTK